MARKKYEQLERRYVPDYVNETFPERVTVFYNLALGAPPETLVKLHPELPERTFQKWKKWADAIVILNDRMVLLEGKIRRPITGIGELITYRQLLPDTKELRTWIHLPVEARLITPERDPEVLRAAAAQDISVSIYTPAWLDIELRKRGLA